MWEILGTALPLAAYMEVPKVSTGNQDGTAGYMPGVSAISNRATYHAVFLLRFLVCYLITYCSPICYG